MSENLLPIGLRENPRLSMWIAFEAPDKARISTGKVEIGQGVLTALAQIAAEELDVDLDQIVIRSGETGVTPNEGLTAGSFSIENSGASLRLACAEARQLFLQRAAEKLAVSASALSMTRGVIAQEGKSTGLDYWALREEVSLDRDATGGAPVKRRSDYRIVGRHAPRFDLPAKITGAGFIQDFTPPNLMHARILHQPRFGARLIGFDGERVRRDATVEILREGEFVAFVGRAEGEVAAVHARAVALAEWEGGEPITPDMADPARLATLASIETVSELAQAPPASAQRVTARFSKPYLAHASIATATGLALYENEKLTVWTSSQGVEFFVIAAARGLGIPPTAIQVRHLQGAGCYGHNGSDDAAFEAAVIAMKRPGQAIRVCWTRAEELANSPFGPPMLIEVEAALGPDKRPISWRADVWSGGHTSRPGLTPLPFLSETARKNETYKNSTFELPLARGGGATRCAVPYYAFSTHKVTSHIVADMPVRTSALRGLGTFANVFAVECFMDELAAAAGEDPVAYRLSCTQDARARRIIERAAEAAKWRAGAPGGDGAGRGFAFNRYKGDGAYVALVVDIALEEGVRVNRMHAIVDCGLAISPDGVRNQIEGGMLQALSWTLLEEVRFGEGAVASASWADYPILRFGDAPEIEIELIGSIDDPPLGVGEAVTGPAAAAIANAVSHALGGIRFRDLPLTRERISAVLNG